LPGLPNTQEIDMKTPNASTNLPRLVGAAILGLLAFGSAAVCVAGENGDVPHAVVKFGDLNLSTADGAAALYHRINAAASNLCGSFRTKIADLPDPQRQYACVRDAVRNAVIAIDQPALSAIYNARNRIHQPPTVASAQNR
jgi:UrcA family protein